MSITGSNNPFACNPVVFANANSIVSLGTITRVGNEFTFSVGFVWKINGVTYQNTTPVVITIAEASEGFNRIDNALLNTSNTIELQQGLESDTIALRPVAPETNIILTSWNISGTTIGDTAPSIVGVEFKKKIENTRYKSTLSGENVIIPFQAAGQSHYSVTNAALVSVAGFTTAGLTTPMYEGQDVIFENQTGHEIALKDSFDVDTPFVIGADLLVPNNGKLWFRFRNNELELIMKSWIEVDLSTKADLVGGKVPSSQLPSYVDDVLEFANLAAFPEAGETEKIYVALDTNFTYRWSGSVYVKISDSVKLDKSTTPSSVYGTDASGEQTIIPVSQFKDVLEFSNSGAFPATGESGKIYVDLDTNLQYRWSGSAYVQFGGGVENYFVDWEGYIQFTQSPTNWYGRSIGPQNVYWNSQFSAIIGTNPQLFDARQTCKILPFDCKLVDASVTINQSNGSKIINIKAFKFNRTANSATPINVLEIFNLRYDTANGFSAKILQKGVDFTVNSANLTKGDCFLLVVNQETDASGLAANITMNFKFEKI